MQNPYPAQIEQSPEAAGCAEIAHPLNHLSPEEQMALFEAELLLTDWGNQPG